MFGLFNQGNGEIKKKDGPPLVKPTRNVIYLILKENTA